LIVFSHDDMRLGFAILQETIKKYLVNLREKSAGPTAMSTGTISRSRSCWWRDC